MSYDRINKKTYIKKLLFKIWGISVMITHTNRHDKLTEITTLYTGYLHFVPSQNPESAEKTWS